MRLVPVVLLAGLFVVVHRPTLRAQEPAAQPLTRKQLLKQQKLRNREPFWSWLNEDVLYIITDQERRAFRSLKTDAERAQFIDEFWSRRDPTPDTPENEYKEEYYRRIAYADEQFASAVPGWKADRGLIYIKFGSPDEIESHPGGDGPSALPMERWHYRYIDGIGTNVVVEFVDSTKSGEYHLANDPESTMALYVEPAGQNCLSESTSAYNQKTVCTPVPESKLERYGRATPNFKDLEALADSATPSSELPIQIRTDFTRVTDSTTSLHLMLRFDTNSKSNINLYARITRVDPPFKTWFEGNVPASQIYSKEILLPPGTYRLNIAAKDTFASTVNVSEQTLVVPGFTNAESLGASSLILADHLARIPTQSTVRGQLLIRSTELTLRIDNVFKQSETMGIYAEFYNLAIDQITRKPQGRVEYEIVNASDGKLVASASDDLADPKAFPKASPFLLVVEKKFALKSLPPGAYTLKMKLVDRPKNQTLTPSAGFTVTS